jgi:hypothetical protein
MLNELNKEALDLLNGRPIVGRTLRILRWMSPARQVESAKLMLSTGDFSTSFVQALLLATEPEDRLLRRGRPVFGVSQEQKVKMQRELKSLLSEVGIMDSYGADMLSLVIASRYISKLINNQAIEKYLSQSYPATLQEFQSIVAAASREGGGALVVR